MINLETATHAELNAELARLERADWSAPSPYRQAQMVEIERRIAELDAEEDPIITSAEKRHVSYHWQTPDGWLRARLSNGETRRVKKGRYPMANIPA